MAELTVAKEDRPSIGKYVIYTVVGIAIVNSFVAVVVQGAGDSVLSLLALIVAGLADVAILFLMVQSLVEEWFQVAEITTE
ncbi:MAG: hypothetical protein ACI9YT_000148 [Halobacteriales archaeon]|jgi:hypothetical protein